eukprot:m.509994 g.509994  ORF g.509994 m.509994 type:complete len:232 (-) comp57413_c0_seq4:74-769(-)
MPGRPSGQNGCFLILNAVILPRGVSGICFLGDLVCQVNPPHVIPLVELVPAPWTHPDVLARTRALMAAIGQSPIVVKKEVNGFILNRLQYALLMEAWRLVEDGVATAEDVDTAVSDGLGLRWSFMGPFKTIDLNAPSGLADYCERYGANITAVCEEQGTLGARSLKGSTTALAIDAEMRQSTPLQDLPVADPFDILSQMPSDWLSICTGAKSLARRASGGTGEAQSCTKAE